MKNEKSLYELNRIQQYIMQMRPVLDKSALFSDGTADYRKPMEPGIGEDVTIRFRAKQDNVDAVFLCCQKYRFEMEKAETDNGFDYYEYTLRLADQVVSYYFEIVVGRLVSYYDAYGPCKELRPQYSFRVVPGFSTPDWAKGAVMYQILVDRFYNGDPTNDVETNEYFYIRSASKKIENWDQVPSSFSVAEFYGGDLEGVRQKLDYLQSLGVEAIYFNPLFVSPSNHKYDIQDYDAIDPHYGRIIDDGGSLLPKGSQDNRKAERYIRRVTSRHNLEASNQLFIKLVEEIHAKGMKVILDGVFNHCGSFNKWMDREQIYHGQEGYENGAYIDKDSPYKDFFHFSDEQGWPFNATYDGWWGHDTLPKLNYEGSKELYDYILEVGRKWVSPPYNADGWRLDVAADLGHGEIFNHQFWRDFRRAVKDANPKAIILAEHYGDPRSWLAGDQWDTIMNYDAFMEPVTWFLTGMEKHSDRYEVGNLGNYSNFKGAMKHYMNCFLPSSLYCSMNQLSNHDHSRFLTRTNHRVGRIDQLGEKAASEGIQKGVFREAVVIQMTWPGAPTLYYGDEAGVTGFTDPDNRRTYPWGHEDRELIAFHRDMIHIHKGYRALRTGSVMFLYGEQHVLCYGRFCRDEQMVVLVNNKDSSYALEVSVWPLGIARTARLKQLICTSKDGYSIYPEHFCVEQGQLKVTMREHSAMVLLAE